MSTEVLSSMKGNHILKFRKINKHLIDSLVHSQLYFALPEQLNDPFDCQVDIEKALQNAISQSSDWKRDILQSLQDDDRLRKEINHRQQDLKNHGVFSSARKASLHSSLMWTHYADNHKGICLIYDIPESFIHGDTNHIYGIANVIYGTNGLTEWFKKLPENCSIHTNAFWEMVKVRMIIKDACWEYEKEMRILRRISGLQTIEQSYLQHICFGLNTPDSEMTLIRRIIDKFGYDVAFSKMQRTGNDCEIQPVDE